MPVPRSGPTSPALTDPRPQRIGVLSPVTGGFFFGEILAGVVREAARTGARVALLQTLDAGLTGEAFPRNVAAAPPVGWDHLDGFVVSAWGAAPDYVRRLRAAGKAVALACTTADGADARPVVVDNAQGVRAAVDHLHEHGHTRIAFAGCTAQTDIRERHEAYLARMAELGLEPISITSITNDVEPGGEAAADLVAAMPERCTAVVAATDRIGLGLVSGLRRHGVSVPDDVALVGFDDVPAGWYSDPQLTTVRQRFDEVGAAAAGVLLTELATGEHRTDRLSVPTVFVRRRSCGCDLDSVEPTAETASAAEALVAEVEDLLAPAGAVDADAALVDRLAGELDALVTARLERLLAAAPAPEDVDGFAQVALRALSARAAGGTGAAAELHQRAVGRVAATINRLQGRRDHGRVDRLSQALGEQYDVGMGLLGDTDGDPADLAWLDGVGVVAGCLGLWESTPAEGRLVVTGVHGPAGTLEHTRGTVVPVEAFPPPEVLDLADAAEDLVAYLIPVRGAWGDQGMLCLVARAEPEFATDRATYDHWAAFLGAGLREKRLLAELRHSEERYAIATRAAKEGLWEWNGGSDVYVSDRCADLLSVTPGHGVTIDEVVSRLHPEDRADVVATLTRAHQERGVPVETEGRLRRPDGATRWVRVRALGATSERGPLGIVGSLADIDDVKQLEERLRQAALLDEVTGLPNRRLFLDRLAQSIARAGRVPGARFAVLFFDLDGFKLVNDSLGHLAGDRLLRVVGARLREQVRGVDTPARFGGDEFAVLLTDPMPDDLLGVARRIQTRIAAPVSLGGQDVSVTASVGIAVSETEYTDAEDVLRDADIAMYRAKESERGTACVFDPEMHRRAMDRLRTRSTITTALEAGEFVVHYQPIVDLDGSGLHRFEALVRWEHPERGLLAPGAFLPAMEGTTAIVTLGHQVLEQVCAQLAAWRAEGFEACVSVNLSHREFWDPDLLTVVREAMARHGIGPESLVLEITEGVVMSDPDAAHETMTRLHDAGLRLHMDDFGTGQSSLHALRTFPVDALKIDGSFIRDLGDEQPTALVRAIVAMASALGLEVVAECVETPEQAAALREMGCTTAQGWLYSRAVPGADAAALLGVPLAEPV